jgi:hypothetical protein
MSKTYCIIDQADVADVDFSQVFETSADTLRWSTTDKTFVKFEGDTPSFLEGKTQYTHSEIRTILDQPEWSPTPPG